MVDLKFEVIPSSKVRSDRDYLLRHRVRDDGLSDCIRSLGFVQPLFGLRDAAGFLKIVSGFRRFEAARGLGLESLPFVFLSEEHAVPKQIFRVALSLNAVPGMAELDKAISIRKARDCFGFDWSELIPLAASLGFPVSRRVLEEYDEIGRMPDWLLDRISDGELPFKGAKALLLFAPEDRLFLAGEVLRDCEWSASEFSAVCEWIDEISRRERVNAREVMKGDPFRKILSEELTPKERGSKLMEILRRVRFPIYSKAEGRYQKIKQAVEEGTGIRLGGTSFYEDGMADLNLKFRSVEELTKLADSIRAKEKLFKELFRLVE